MILDLCAKCVFLIAMMCIAKYDIRLNSTKLI